MLLKKVLQQSNSLKRFSVYCSMQQSPPSSKHISESVSNIFIGYAAFDSKNIAEKILFLYSGHLIRFMIRKMKQFSVSRFTNCDCLHKKTKFSLKNFFTFTEEILNGKLHFLNSILIRQICNH